MQPKRRSKSHLTNKLRRIRLVILDVDGVLTDGRIIFGWDGTEYKCFDAHDGFGITRALECKLKLAVISGKTSKVTQLRLSRLGVRELYQNQMDKVKIYLKLKAKYHLRDDETCFIGDDEFDVPLLRMVGFSAAPSDAMSSVRYEVDYVTKAAGGRGAVREVLDMILSAKKLIEHGKQSKK